MKTKNTEDKRNGKFYRVCYKIFAAPIRLLFRVKVIGRQNEPDAGPYLVCANHQSATDPVLICSAFRKNPVGFMAKAELFFWPLGPLIRALGAYPVNRKAGDVGAIRTSLRLLEEGQLVGMFPQGTRHPGEDPRTTSVRGGAAMIAYHAGATVLPVFIYRKDHTPLKLLHLSFR